MAWPTIYDFDRWMISRRGRRLIFSECRDCGRRFIATTIAALAKIELKHLDNCPRAPQEDALGAVHLCPYRAR
jgi:hypothetical protein